MRSTPAHTAVFLAVMLTASCVQTPPPELTWTEPDAGAAERVATFTAKAPDARIAGEIHAARGADPKTAVIIVGGSGMRTRSDTAPAIPLFMDSDVAVAIYDRRGNGESTGAFEIPDTENSQWLVPAFARDVTAIANLLKQNGYERVGLLGTSMGGWINVAAAASSGDVDFIICISGGASTVGVSDAFDLYTDEGKSIDDAIAAARRYDGPPGYDPSADMKAFIQPALWVFGDLDDSNPTALDAETVARFQADGKNFTLIILPGVNHDLITTRAFIAGKPMTP
jgi:pimeloyl-ACP methyl ester carboxylesterase